MRFTPHSLTLLASAIAAVFFAAFVVAGTMWYGAAATPIELFGPTRYQWDQGYFKTEINRRVQTAIDKGFTAVSFRTDTLEFARLTGPQSLAAGVRQIPRVVAVGGGVQISAGGQLLGAVGVSGAPTGEADELCAKAGIEAIREDIEL